MLKIIVTALIIILLITTTVGLHAKIEKRVTDWLEISRVLYFVLLTASVVHIILHFTTQFWGDLLWILFLIVIYVVMETAFRLKRETFGNPHLTRILFVALLVSLVVGYLWI